RPSIGRRSRVFEEASRAWLRMTFTSAAMVLLATLAPAVIRARSAQGQPVDEMIVLSGDPSAGRARVVHLGADVHRRMPGRAIHKPRFRPPRYARQAWLHPLLERWLRDPSRAPRRAQLVVVFP